MATSNLEIVIKAKDEASEKLNALKSSMGGVANVAGGVLKAGMVSATVAIAGLGFVLKKSYDEGIEYNRQQSQLEAVLKSTKGAVGLTADEINRMNNKLQDLNAIEDDAIMTGENMLLTFTNIGKDAFPRATQAMLDMATKMNNGVTPSAESLKGTAIQLGKALNDPAQGLTALSRVGVSFTAEQKNLIESLQKTGDVAGAQAIILAELEREFGGSAKAAGNVDPYQRLQLAFKDIYQVIGTQVIPIIADIITAIQPVITKVLEFAGVVLPQALAFIQTFFAEASSSVNGFVIDWQGIWFQVQTTVMNVVTYFRDVVFPAVQTFITGIIKSVSDMNINWGAIWATIQGTVQTVATFFLNEILPMVQKLFDLITKVVSVFMKVWNENWLGIQDVFKFAWDIMKTTFETAWGLIKIAIDTALAIFSGDWGKVWNGISAMFSKIWEGISGTITRIVAGIIDTIMAVPRAIGKAMDAVKNFGGDVSGSFNPILNTGGSVGVPGAGGGSVHLASGGIVTRPTRALIGEGGEAEAVIPLSRLNGMMGGGGSTNITFDFSGSTLLSEETAVRITDMVIDKLRRVTKLPSRST